MNFVFNRPVEIEETLRCEFKEVSGQPLQSVKKVDRYVVAFLNADGGSIYWGIRDNDRAVTGLQAPYSLRDEIRQVIGQKVASIAPPLPSSLVDAPFHPVKDAEGRTIPDTHVLEVKVEKPQGARLFLTGSGEAYRRTMGGIQKLTGAELLIALGAPLAEKVKQDDESFISRFPSVVRRAQLVAPLVHERRALLVDDDPSYTFYERVALAEIGVKVDVATTSDSGIAAALRLKPHVIISDIARHGQSKAGLEFLSALRSNGITCPVVFYIARLDPSLGVPPGAFGITNRPDEVIHLILDVFERSG